MLAFIAKRMVAIIPVMGVVALFVFLMLRLSPGDPASIIAGDYASPSDIERIREQLGLNASIPVQFGKWIWTLAQGDLGISIFTNLPVTKLIAQRIEPTLMLSLTTLVFAVLVAVPLGVVAAWKAGSWIDRSIMVFAVAGFSISVFVLGYILIFQFSLELRWLPVQGYTSPFVDFWKFSRHIILPTLTLSVIYIALITRITRASVIEVLEEDYIRTARAKGLPERLVILRHALKPALLPVISFLGPAAAAMITGSVVIEQIFGIPGLGRHFVQGALNRDYTLVMGVVVFYGTLIIFFNFVVDLLYALLDPRVKYR